MIKLECNELPDNEKAMHYEILKKYSGEEGIKKLTQMIAVVGVEVAAGRVIGAAIKQGQKWPQDMVDCVYNACLYIHKLQQMN